MKIQSRFALTSVTVVDGLGREPRPHHAVVVEHGRITAVLPMSHYRPDADVHEIDLDGHFVMPGLIDAHVHLAGGRADMSDQELGVIAEPKLMRAMRSVHQAQKLLKRGFTTARDISWNGLYLKRLFHEQELPGPKVIACGPGLTRTGGHADLFQFTDLLTGRIVEVCADPPRDDHPPVPPGKCRQSVGPSEVFRGR
ncbi:amidohydrolase family protein [Dactylosporangium sp. NPDC048998]|uniref:amidohydrolase family protein n=1 Tax=Dactylosporangium sp. NPDC048998 TaxID=3363976 RepID=UPI00371DAAD4